MGCNVDKAKADIYDILTEDQKDFSESSIKKTTNLAKLILEKLKREIKGKFVWATINKIKIIISRTFERKAQKSFLQSF